MKAVYINRYGAPEVLKFGELPKPESGPHTALVRVKAAGINPIDWKIRQGKFKLLPFIKFPLVIGFDLCGVIEEAGENSGGFKAGDEVIAMLPPWGGAYAEFASVKYQHLAKKPKHLSFEESAGLPLASLTAWQGLIEQGNLQEGVRVLVIGASGGVGGFAVQIAKTCEAHVTGVCSAGNIELVKSLGADEVVDYTKSDIHEFEGFDIVFDVAGNERFNACRPMLKKGGRFVSTEPVPSTIISHVATRVSGIFANSKQARVFNCNPGGETLSKIVKLVENNKIKPIVDKVFRLEEAKEAHEYSETRRAKGKIILKID